MDVTVDSTLIENAFRVIEQHVYLGDLRSSRRIPLDELRRALTDAQVNGPASASTHARVTCGSCGVPIDRCSECGVIPGESAGTGNGEPSRTGG